MPHRCPFLLRPQVLGRCCSVCREIVTEHLLLCLSLALEQLLTELDNFLKVLDQENLSSAAMVRKSGLAELLRLYTKSSSKYRPGASVPREYLPGQAILAWCHGAFHNTPLFPHTVGDQLLRARSQQGWLFLQTFSHSHLCVCLLISSCEDSIHVD